METSAGGWTIIDDDAGVLSLTYSFSGGTANCFTAKLADGRLMIVSPPIKISGAALDEIVARGGVGALVANNGFHYLGIETWRARFPKARCFAAEGAAKRIAKKAPDTGDFEPLHALQALLPEGVAVVEAPGSPKFGETWARAAIAGGHAYYGSDILANMKMPKAFVPRLLFKLTKSAPGYKVFNLATKIIFKNRKAGLAAMLEDIRKHPPTVVVPGHGEIVSGPELAAETEKMLAASV